MSLTALSPGYTRHMDEMFEEEIRNPQPDYTHELYLESMRLQGELAEQREQHRKDIDGFLGELQQRYTNPSKP